MVPDALGFQRTALRGRKEVRSLEDVGVMGLIAYGVPWGAVVFTSLLVMADYFAGIVTAALRRELTSSAMRDGLLRKSLLFLLLISGVLFKCFFLVADIPTQLVDIFGLGALLSLFGVQTTAEIPVCMFFCVAISLMEMYSILETVSQISARAARLLSRFQSALPPVVPEAPEEKRENS